MTSPTRCDGCENLIDSTEYTQHKLCAECLRQANADNDAAHDWQAENAEANERASCHRGPDCGGECRAETAMKVGDRVMFERGGDLPLVSAMILSEDREGFWLIESEGVRTVAPQHMLTPQRKKRGPICERCAVPLATEEYLTTYHIIADRNWYPLCGACIVILREEVLGKALRAYMRANPAMDEMSLRGNLLAMVSVIVEEEFSEQRKLIAMKQEDEG